MKSNAIEQLVPKVKEILEKMSNGKGDHLKSKLTVLKRVIMSTDKQIRDMLCFELLSMNICNLLAKSIESEQSNRLMVSSCGEMLFLLFSSVSQGSSKQLKEKWKEYTQKRNPLASLSSILMSFDKENKVQEMPLFLKVYMRIVDCDVLLENEEIDFSFHLKLVNALLDKHKHTEDPITFILETTLAVIQLDRFKLYYTEGEKSKEKEDECFQLVKRLLQIPTEAQKLKKNIIKALKCLNMLMHIPTNVVKVRNEPFIIPSSLLLRKYSNHLVIPIELCSFLSKIMNKDDLFILIEAIKETNNEDVHFDELDYKIAKEIREKLTDESKESFDKFKRSAMDVIWLLSKEKHILLILRDLNTLESLVHSYKSFFQKEEKSSQTSMSIILQLIVRLAHCYTKENVEGVELSSVLLKNVLCLSMNSIELITDEGAAHEVMAFFFRKALNLKDIFTDANDKKEIIEASKVFFPFMLNKYYFNNWLSDYLKELPIATVPSIDSVDFEAVCLEVFNDIKAINSSGNSGSHSEQISKIEQSMNTLTLKLSLGIQCKAEGVKSFQLSSSKTLCKVFELILGANKAVFERSHSINQILSLMFSALESKSNSDEQEKCSCLLQFINKLTLRKQIDDQIILYLTIRLYQLSIINNCSIKNMIFSSEVIVTFAIHCLSYPNISLPIAEGIMNILLLAFKSSAKSKSFISQLFTQNGLIKIVRIGINQAHQSLKLTKSFGKILHVIKTKYVEQLVDYCNDDIFFQEYISLIKDVHFSTNSISEYCYSQLLDIFFLVISLNQFSKELIESTQLVDYFVQEAMDVFNFYSNTSNPLLLVVIQILAVIFGSIGEMMVMITPVLFELICLIFTQVMTQRNKKTLDHENFKDLVQILVKVNLKETEFVYMTHSYREIIKALLLIVNEQSGLLKEESINSCLTLFEKWLQIEEITFSPPSDLFSIAYFKELTLKFPRSSKRIKTKLDNLASMIERGKIRRHDIIEEYAEIEKSLSLISTKKRINQVVVRQKKTIDPQSTIDTSEETTNVILNQRRRTSVNLSSNPSLKVYYDKITSSLKAVLIAVKDKQLKEGRIESECEQIAKLIQILKIFARDRENCQKLYGKDAMSILISIINMTIGYSFPKNEVYLLLNKVAEQIDSTNEEFNYEELIQNEAACLYFIREIVSIKNNYDTEVSDLIYNKTSFITNILAKLSNEKRIILNNTEYLNPKELMIILKNMTNDHVIILNLMEVFNNIIALNKKDSIDYIKDSLEDFCKLMLETLWNAHKMDFRVIELILKALDNIKEEEVIVNEMLKHFDFQSKLNEMLTEKSDATLMVMLFTLLDSLIVHKDFADSFLDFTGVNNIIKASQVYKSYKTIIEKALSIFSSAIQFPNGGFISSLGKYGLNGFCIFLFETFMNTSNEDIIKSILSIVESLMRDDYNRRELSSKRNVETIQSLFLKKLENEKMIIDILPILLKQITIEGASTNGYTLIEPKASTDSVGTEAINYDLDLMMIIIEKTLMNYNKNKVIVKEIAKIVRILFKQTSDEINKLRFFESLLFFMNSYLELSLVASIELLINEVNNMIEDQRMPCLVKSLGSIIASINQLFSTYYSHNKTIYNQSIEILLKITANNESAILLKIANLFPTLQLIKSKVQYHDDLVLLNFSGILLNLFKSDPFEIPVEYLLFVLCYIEALSPEKKSEAFYLRILENTKGVADNYLIKEEKEGKQCVSLLISLFKANIDNDNNIERIIMIIRKLILHSNVFKAELNQPEIDFVNMINGFVKSIKGKNKMFLEYQGMSISCILSSKIEETSQPESQISTMEMKMSQQEINPEMKQYLSVSHLGKYYSEAGAIKSVLLKMDEKLTFIEAIDKGVAIDSMKVQDMESCVRSCSTLAFEKSKNIKNLFAKKPSAKKCFSIFAVKTLSGQKTFNIQCDTEDDCIKYVDYLSTLINNRKTMNQ